MRRDGTQACITHRPWPGLRISGASPEHLRTHALLLEQQLGAPPCPEYRVQFLEGVKEGGKKGGSRTCRLKLFKGQT